MERAAPGDGDGGRRDKDVGMIDLGKPLWEAVHDTLRLNVAERLRSKARTKLGAPAADSAYGKLFRVLRSDLEGPLARDFTRLTFEAARDD